MMRTRAIPVAAMLALVAGTAMGGDLVSGLQPGDKAGPFNVKDCTGPAKGESLCYR